MNFFRSHSPAAAEPKFRIADEAEACAAVLMACLRSNELDSDEENAAFYTTINSRNIFKGRDAQALIRSAVDYYREAGGPAALIDAAMGAIRTQTRLPLFCHCLDVILSDGVVTPQEHKIFQYLKRQFKVDDDLADKTLEILVMKNQL